MTKIIIITFTILFSFLHYGFGQSQDMLKGGDIMIDENTIIKDESGNKVGMSDFMDLMNSGEWMMDPVNDSNGKMKYVQLRKATEEEKKMMAEMPMPGSSSELIGENVPEFKFEDINGNVISSENTKGKVVVLNFWFTACKPCIAEIPELNEVFEKYKNSTNVIFASITFDKEKRVKKFLKKHIIEYPVVSNATELCNLFQITAYPTNIVIDKEGKYLYYETGGFPNIGESISNSIQTALQE